MNGYLRQYHEKYGQPAAEHKLLEPLVGTWEAKGTTWEDEGQPGIPSTGTLTRTAVLGGRFVREAFTGGDPAHPYQGFGVIGYDCVKKHFVENWVDSFSTTITDLTGTYDAGTKTFSFKNKYTCPITGKPMETRQTLQVVGPDEEKLVMYRKTGDEKEVKTLDLTLTRKK